MDVKELERRYPWLPLLCDACHTKLTTEPEKYSPFDLCERCEEKFLNWCDAEEDRDDEGGRVASFRAGQGRTEKEA